MEEQVSFGGLVFLCIWGFSRVGEGEEGERNPSKTCFRVGSKGYSEYEAANLAGVKGRNCDEVQLFG